MKEKTLNIGKSIRKKRFVSFFTAMFIVVSALGDCLPVLAEFASNIDGIEDVTGNAEKNKEMWACLFELSGLFLVIFLYLRKDFIIIYF